MNIAKSLKYIIPVIVVFALIVLGVYQLYKHKVQNQDNQAEVSPSPTPITGFEISPPPSASPNVLGGKVPAMQPASGSDTVEVKNVGIYADLPTQNQHVSSPVQVKGRANVFDGKVQIRVLDTNGNYLGQGSATACLGVDACPFEASIAFSTPTASYGTIELYSPNAVDDSEDYLQKILVNF